jgi:hypothetical protein
LVELPTRLIEVSPSGAPEFALLLSTQGEKGRYIALSYCWGDPQPFALPKAVRKAYSKRLPYTDLPKTTLDAFEVTRSLGLQFIWIDSMCIVQDDPEDVNKEIAKMLQIYENSLLTISAACASSCNESFLEILDYRGGYLPVRVDEDVTGSILLSKMELTSWTFQPINNRAWTLQESLLTPRLLIFTGINMFWQCQVKFESYSWVDTRLFTHRDSKANWSFHTGYLFILFRILQPNLRRRRRNTTAAIARCGRQS